MIKSPTFSSTTNDKVKWYLQLEPGNETSDKISLFLYYIPESNQFKTLAQMSISFIDSQRNLLKTCGPQLYEFSHKTSNRGLLNIPLKEVVSPNNTLNIVCNIAICQYSNNVVYRQCDSSQNSVPSIKNSQLPDVVLVLTKNGKEYHAEKAKLASGSPVFAAMFKSFNETGEEVKRINITDVDEEQVFEELLHYINTNKSENIDKMSTDLLIAADKYGMDTLKTSCVTEISKNLTIGNVVDTLLLADEHGFSELKSNAIRFIAVNYAQLSNTSDWKQILEKNSKLVHEVCHGVIRQLHG